MAAAVGAGFGGLIDLNGIVGATQTNLELKQKQADEEAAIKMRQTERTDRANREILQINDASLASSQQNREAQLGVLSGIATQIDKAKQAIALSDSTNPMDRLKLWMLQQTDPAYTQSGNLERISYLQQAANALGGIETIKQAGFQEQIQAVSNQLQEDNQLDEKTKTLLAIQVEQGQRRLDAAIEANSNMTTLMKQNADIQQSTLTNMTDEQLTAAEADMAQKNTKSVNVNGVELPKQAVLDFARARKQQKYNDYIYGIQVAQTTTQTMTMEQTDAAIVAAQNSKDGKTEVNGISIDLATLQARKSALLNQDANAKLNEVQLANANAEMLKITNQQYIDSMSVTQLNRAIMNGGKIDESGRTFDLEQLKRARDLKSEAATNQVNQDISLSQMKSPYYSAVETGKYLDSIKAAPGTQLSSAIATQKQALAAAANLAESALPEEQYMYMQIVDNVRKNVDEAVKAQAAFEARGDKDKEAALNYTLRGQAVPPEVIQSALETRLTKNKPLTDWLSPKDSLAARNQYQNIKQGLVMQYPMMSDSERSQMAAAQTLEFLKTQQQGAVSDQIRAFETQMTDSPLNQTFGNAPGKFLSLIREADMQAAQEYQKNNKLNDKQMNDLLTGVTSDPTLTAMQFGFLYNKLEQLKPGLGDAYVDWWNSDGKNQMIDRYASSQGQVASTFQDNIARSLILPDLTDMLSGVGVSAEDGRRYMQSTYIMQQHALFSQFGGKPESKQLFLLQNDPSLNDTDRQKIFATLIQPLIKQANDQGLNAEQSTGFIESQLRSMRPEDPEAKALLQKLLKNRDAGITSLENWAKAQTNPWLQTNQYLLPGYDNSQDNAVTGITNRFGAWALNLGPNLMNAANNTDAANDLTSAYGWYVDLLKRQGAGK